MIKIFIPQVKGRIKTSIRRFWRGDNGKIYYDYLSIEKCVFGDLKLYKEDLKQEALFYIAGNNRTSKRGCVYYSDNKIEILPHRIYNEVRRQDLKSAIKTALAKYSGCTVYIVGRTYYIEVFTTL